MYLEWTSPRNLQDCCCVSELEAAHTATYSSTYAGHSHWFQVFWVVWRCSPVFTVFYLEKNASLSVFRVFLLGYLPLVTAKVVLSLNSACSKSFKPGSNINIIGGKCPARTISKVPESNWTNSPAQTKLWMNTRTWYQLSAQITELAPNRGKVWVLHRAH